MRSGSGPTSTRIRLLLFNPLFQFMPMSVLNSSHRQSRLAKFMQWVVSKLPPRLKRIVFIGLMLGVFNEKEHPDAELISKINDSLRLADNPRAYELPLAVQNIIWTDFHFNGLKIRTTFADGKEVLTSESKTAICKHIISNLPDWIKYASSARIYNDLLKLINQIECDKKVLHLPH